MHALIEHAAAYGENFSNLLGFVTWGDGEGGLGVCADGRSGLHVDGLSLDTLVEEYLLCVL